MEEIIEYTYNWLRAMSDGRKFSGHDFFSGFPQPYKEQISKLKLDTLYYALSLISEYDEKVDLSYYDFLEDKTLRTLPWRMGKRGLTCFLHHALINIELKQACTHPHNMIKQDEVGLKCIKCGSRIIN